MSSGYFFLNTIHISIQYTYDILTCLHVILSSGVILTYVVLYYGFRMSLILLKLIIINYFNDILFTVVVFINVFNFIMSSFLIFDIISLG